MLESWFFFCFHGFSDHWVQICYWFFIFVMTWRHDVMSWRQKNLIYLSQLVDVLESWFFFCFHVFLGHEFKNVIDISFVWWRHVMTSCHAVTKPDLPISACRCARELILFLFPWFFRSLSSKMLLIFYLCDDLTSWRHKNCFTYLRLWIC